ncbi:nucleoprotein [Fujian dimarhabdovirus]|uniref:Nucleoprotein n=1 Tax=Fujian dimarhabdovirus TaxID=2116366 RepID=A0A2P1GMR5_9RHAB|nr:nucleoprotein [Fujian dimarhabdovirus]
MVIQVYDFDKKIYVDAISTVPVSVIAPEYYPESEPSKKIVFTYGKGPGWTIELAANTIYDDLRSSAVCDPNVQIYFLAEFLKTKKYIACDNITVGSFSAKKGESLTAELYIQFEAQDRPDWKPLKNLSDDLKKIYDGLTLWLLIQVRLWNSIGDNRRVKYSQDVIEHVKRISGQPPFNIDQGTIRILPVDPEYYSASKDNNDIGFLAAAYDYFSIVSSTELEIRIRIATLTTRFEDHMALNQLANLSIAIQLSLEDFFKLIVTAGAARDLLHITKPGQGIDKRWSLTPYSRSMNLVAKSYYSLTENPHFCTLISVFLGSIGNKNQFYITKTNVYVDCEITLGYKIAQYLGLTEKFARYVKGSEDSIGPLHVPLPDTPKETSIDEIAKKLIEEMRAQGGRPNRMELEQMVAIVRSLEDRPGTLQEYIKTMTPCEEKENVWPE